jgi:hypothetical protein
VSIYHQSPKSLILIEKAGYEVAKNIVEDPSEELKLLYKKGDDWLS